MLSYHQDTCEDLSAGNKTQRAVPARGRLLATALARMHADWGKCAHCDAESRLSCCPRLDIREQRGPDNRFQPIATDEKIGGIHFTLLGRSANRRLIVLDLRHPSRQLKFGHRVF